MGARLTIGALAAGLAIAIVSSSPAAAATTEIAVEDNFFAPARVGVTSGDTVRWTFAGMQASHTVTLVPAGGGAPLIDEDVSPGRGPLELVTGATGRFTLLCQIHSPMRGRVDVLAASEPSAPTITAALSPAAPGPGETYGGPVRLTLAAGDDSGVDSVELRVNGGSFAAYSGPREFDTEGARTVQYRATDIAGLTTSGSISFTIDDAAPPVTTHELSGDGFTRVALMATDDGGLGVASTEYRVDQAAFAPYTDPFRVEGSGPHVVEYRSTDRAGNIETLREVRFSNAGPGSDPVGSARLLSPPRMLRAAALSGGVEVESRCSGPDPGTLSLEVGRRAAQRLGVRPGRALATASPVPCDGSRAAAFLRPPRSVRRALGEFKGSVQATLGLAANRASDTAVVRIRGARRR